MRVRPMTPTRARSERRPHVIEARPVVAEAAPAADHPAERRHRASVSPEDSALYTCGCGFAFQAAVTTSVACPQCGSGQAW
jgi:hypothetical protein